MARLYKWLFDALPKLRDSEARYWPDYVYVPLDVLKKHILEIMKREDFMQLRGYTLDDGHSASALADTMITGLMWATWRLTQGVYRFDEALYPHLINTQGTGEIPIDILCRLPEWCVHLETPGLRPPTNGDTTVPMYGVWASIDLNKANPRGGLGFRFQYWRPGKANKHVPIHNPAPEHNRKTHNGVVTARHAPTTRLKRSQAPEIALIWAERRLL
jgi:hypothetical protein